MKRKNCVIICYDIVDDKIRTQIADFLITFGTRQNYSVFLCMLTVKQLQSIKHKLSELITHDTDSVLFYRVCLDCFASSDQIGRKTPPPETVIIT